MEENSKKIESINNESCGITTSSMKESCTEETTKDEGDNVESFCPLFMDGLPKDFDKNPALAAIASLLEDGDPKVETPITPTSYKLNPKPGGGKLSRRTSSQGRSRTSRRNKPYEVPKKSKSSVGETQLFLKMWKL